MITVATIWMIGLIVLLMACGVRYAMCEIFKKLFWRAFEIILGLTVAWLAVGFGVLMIMWILNSSWV